MDITTIGYGVVAGAVGGIGWALLGNAVIIADPEKRIKEEFSLKKFSKSVIVGAILGGYAGYSGMALNVGSFEALQTDLVILTPATAIANKIIDTAWNVYKWLKSKLFK